MKKHTYLAFLLFGLITLTGCQSKQEVVLEKTIEEKYNGIGESYAKDIAKQYSSIEESKFLSVCLYKVDASGVNGNEEITFITNKCIKELAKIYTENIK
ncbi:hypothetical protein [Aliarcobacter butzleri]|uniref:hypothetical protein n=1 Tax=Aliarcobacter butzleri TaxID=28197 RepID=UPI001269FDE7|nr:hypothetical protein [Aliarcobacter butzleri]